jgi:hypothetical protein
MQMDASNINNTNTEYSLSGAMFYKGILEATYGNTTPVDFVEIPSTQDIIYITPTSIGLIGMRQFQLMDPKNRGYCRVNDVLSCPPDFFGSVQHGTCGACNDTKAAGFGVSVAWQVKCASSTMSKLSSGDKNKFIPKTIMSTDHTSTGERISTLISNDVDEDVLYEAICAYAQTTGQKCPDRKLAGLSPKQQFNSAADFETQDASFTNSMLDSRVNTTSFIKKLIQRAENKNKINVLSTASSAGEYISTWTSQGESMIKSSFSVTQFQSIQKLKNITIQNKTIQYNESKLIQACFFNANVNQITVWLQCAIPFLVNASGANTISARNRRRRLLQDAGNSQNNSNSNLDTKVNSNQDLTLISSSPIVYNPLLFVDNGNDLVVKNMNTQKENSSDAFPMWAGILIGVTGLVVIIVLIFCLNKNKIKNKFKTISVS